MSGFSNLANSLAKKDAEPTLAMCNIKYVGCVIK